MAELLKFEYHRLLKSKFLWVLMGLAFIIPLVAALVINLLVGEVGVDGIDVDKTNVRYFTWYVISYFIERIPLAIAIFIPLFIGRDYKDGFIRNKLTAGHKRIDIFGSAVLTQLSVTVALSVMYILGGLTGCAMTSLGCDINHGEMLLRALTLLLSVMATSILFTAISLLIKSRAGTMVICIAFVFSLGFFSMMASNYSYNREMINEYEELYSEALENISVDYGSPAGAEFDADSYLNAGWYVGHTLFVGTNAALSSEFIPSFSSMITDSEMFAYPKKISRLSFANSYYSLMTGNIGAYIIDPDDLEDIPGAYVTFEEAELQYNIKSVIWAAVFFGAGYALFRKKNVF